MEIGTTADAILNALPGGAYMAWAFMAAALFYGLVRWADNHISSDQRAAISLWLQGDYAEAWSTQFCRLFDGVFTRNHMGWRCMLRSAALSVVSVVAIYLLLDGVLGVLDVRAGGRLELWQALLIGAAVNLIPDYLSLYQTRWVLGRFEKTRSIPGQMLVLLGDLLATGAIIYLGINAFHLARGESLVPLPEMLFLFSVYAIFFYSTFVTSVWAWLYCLSSWVMRALMALGLHRAQVIRENPVPQLALLIAVLAFAGLVAARPALEMDETGRAALDDRLCRLFPVVCDNVAPLTADEELQLEYLALACRGGVDETCLDVALRFIGEDDVEAEALAQRVCDSGDVDGCFTFHIIFSLGHFNVRRLSTPEVARLHQRCNEVEAAACAYLGDLVERGAGVPADPARAVELYRQGCAGGADYGCRALDRLGAPRP